MPSTLAPTGDEPADCGGLRRGRHGPDSQHPGGVTLALEHTGRGASTSRCTTIRSRPARNLPRPGEAHRLAGRASGQHDRVPGSGGYQTVMVGSVLEPKPETAHGADGWAGESSRAQLFPKSLDVVVDRDGKASGRTSVDGLDQVISGERAPGCACQIVQESELQWRQPNSSTVDANLPEVTIQGQGRRMGHCPAPFPLTPSDCRPRPSRQLRQRHRMGHVVVGAQAQRARPDLPPQPRPGQ